MKIAVLGAGSWGSALGQVLAENNHNIKLWHANESFVNKINQDHIHPFLSKVLINKSIEFTSSIDDLCDFGEILISAIPSQGLRSVLSKFPKGWNRPIVSVSKGIENNTGMRMTQVIKESLNIDINEIAVLSGPSHAEEVFDKHPTTIVSACLDIHFARQIQNLFSNNYFRVYSGQDVIGVEIGGATKNVIALAAGICSGIGYGDNTMAALVTRGLEEIIRFGTFFGAQRSTISGLSGMGDLVVTAFSPHSRNRKVGERIGRGEKIKTILSSMKMVAEGVETTRSINEIVKKNKIDMPICTEIFKVLFEDLHPKDAILNLMGRDLIDEHPI